MRQRADSLRKQPDSIRPRLLVLSVDFDGCLAGEQFTALYKNIAHLKQENPARYRDEYKKILKEVHGALLADIHAKARDHDEVMVMIGSNRQVSEIDAGNARKNGNGSCYDGIPFLAELLNEELEIITTINPFVAADAFMNEESGFSVAVYNQARHAREIKHEEQARIENFSMNVKDNKYCLLYLQTVIACASRPEADVTYHFYDDVPEIVGQAKEYFEADGIGGYLPPNLRHFGISQYEDSSLMGAFDTLLVSAREKIKDERAPVSDDEVKLYLQIADQAVKLLNGWQRCKDGFDQQKLIINEQKVRVDEKLNEMLAERRVTANKLLFAAFEHNFPDAASEFKQLCSLAKESGFKPVTDNKNKTYENRVQEAIDTDNYPELLAIYNDRQLFSMLRFSESFEKKCAEFYDEHRSFLNNKTRENKPKLAKIDAEIERARGEQQNCEDILKLANVNLTGIDTLNKDMAMLREKLDQGVSIGWHEFHPVIKALSDAIQLVNKKSLPPIFRNVGGEFNEAIQVMGAQPFFSALNDIISQFKLALVRQDNEKLKPVLVLTEIKETSDAAPINTEVSNKMVNACMGADLWANPDKTPSLQTLSQSANDIIMMPARALTHLRDLLQSPQFKAKIDKDKGASGLKAIYELVLNQYDHPPETVLSDIVAIAVNKANPGFKGVNLAEKVKGFGRAVRVKVGSADDELTKLYEFLAAPNMLELAERLKLPVSPDSFETIKSLKARSVKAPSSVCRPCGVTLFSSGPAARQSSPSSSFSQFIDQQVNLYHQQPGSHSDEKSLFTLLDRLLKLDKIEVQHAREFIGCYKRYKKVMDKQEKNLPDELDAAFVGIKDLFGKNESNLVSKDFEKVVALLKELKSSPEKDRAHSHRNF